MERRTHMLTHRWLKPHHAIVMMGTMMILGFVCGYAISVSNGDVEALFPYISDTGAKPPGSCVFGLLLNIGGMIAFLIIYLRHRQYEKYYALENWKLHILNDVSMFFGYCSALGALLVANFQETNVITVHIIGAFMTFIIGNIYCWIQSYLSIHSSGSISKFTIYIRFILSCLSTVFFIMLFIFTSIATERLRDSGMLDGKNKFDVMMNWKSSYAGYDVHVAATFSEWLMVFCFIFYFFTYYKEFKKMSVKTHMSCEDNYGGIAHDEPVEI